MTDTNQGDTITTDTDTKPTRTESDIRPYLRMKGPELITLIEDGDELAVAEGALRTSKAVQAAVARYQDRPLATITALDPELT